MSCPSSGITDLAIVLVTKMMARSALALALTGATAVWAEDPMTESDDSWISVSGTVESVTNETFVLD